ncbi:MAG TPA: hypothetical protein VGM88_19490 [Kofleriaceae bacterium]
MIPVRARRAAIAAAACVAVYVFVLMCVRVVPDWAVGLCGGPTGLARTGGLTLSYRPPAGADVRAVAQRAAGISGGEVVVEADGTLTVRVTGVTADDLAQVLRSFTRGGVEFRVAFEDATLARYVTKARHVTTGVDVEVWRGESDNVSHTSYFVRAPTRGELDAKLAALKADGWVPMPQTVLAYEHFEATADEPAYWRTFTIADAAALDGSAIASAIVETDPVSARPVVSLELTKAGAQAFGDLTDRIKGGKLATLWGGDVVSAPVVETAIRGGRARIDMGAGDGDRDLRDANALVASLQAGTLPAGGIVESSHLVPPGDASRAELLGRFVIALLCGALAGGVVVLLVVVLRPTREARFAATGAVPWRRVLVTLLAPAALYAATWLPVPYVDGELMSGALSHAAGYPVELSMFELGLAPVFTAFTLVELVALIAPSLRRKRFDPRGRAQLGRWVAVLTVGLAALQAWTLARVLANPWQYAGAVHHDAQATLALTATFTAGSLLLVWLAGVIRDHGLGNGYGALLASGVVLAFVRMLGFVPIGLYALLLATALAGGALFAFGLRWRIGGLRAPTTTVLPVQLVLAFATLLGLLSFLPPFETKLETMIDLQIRLGSNTAIWASIVVGGAAFAYACARPAVTADLRARAGLAAVAWADWARVLLLSLLFVATAFVFRFSLAALVPAAFASALSIATVPLLGAVVLDLAGELRARRASLVKAWPLQQPQHAEVIRAALAAADIPCFLHGANLRALYGPFGAWCPIDVLVAPDHLDAARGKIAALYHAENLGAFD